MASKRIQGITIEIDGNVTGLNKSLSEVDKSLAKTSAALKDVNKLLKFDPKNTELLSQKQNLLEKAISDTKTRLDELKKVNKDAVTSDQWDAVQREIIETEGKLKAYEKELSTLSTTGGKNVKSIADKFKEAGNKVKDFGDKIEKAGKKITDVGKKLAPVSAAAAGIGAAAVKSAMDVDEGYDTIIKKTGATGTALEDLQEQMDGVFAELPTDAATAGEAIGQVNTRFGVTGKSLGDLSKKFVKFADITDQDVTTAVTDTNKVMKIFGTRTEDADKVMGLLAKTSQNTGIDVGTLTGAIETNSATLKDMGLDLTSSVTLLGQFEQNGVDSSTALSALRKAQQNAVKSGKNFKTTLTDGVKSIKNAKTETEALQIATELFGKKGAAEMTKAIREGRLSVDQLSGSLEDYGGVVDQVYQDTLDPWDEMKIAINNLKLAGKELAESLFKTLKPIIDKVVESVKGFTNWFNSLNDKQKETIVKIGLLIAALAPVLTIFGKVVSGIGSIIKVGGGLLTGISSLVTAVSGGGGLIATIGGLVTSIGPYIAIAAAAVAAGVLIYKNWDKIVKAGKKLAKNIGKICKDIGNAISSFAKSAAGKLSSGLKAMGTVAKNTWNGIKTGASNAWKSITSTVSNGVTSMKTKFSNGFTAVKTTVTNAWKGITTAISSGINNVKTKTTNGFNAIKTSMSTAWANISTAASKAWNNIKKNVSGAVSGIGKTAGTLKTSLSTAMSNAGRAMVNAFSNAKTTMQTAFVNLRNNASNALSSIRTAATNAFSAIKSKYSGSFGSVIESIRSKFAGIGQSIVGPFTKAWNTIKQFPSKLRSLFSGVHISLPKIKMPHFTVTWKQIGNLFRIPKISVQWYRKAYENAVMFNRPTVLQTPYGAKGFGDGPGGEVVLGMEKLKQLVGAAGDTNVVINVTAPQGMNVNQLADAIQRRLANVQQQKAYSMT